jgi:hypothetical protein
MNAHCSKCDERTEHRRTQFGSYFRFWCQVCGNELRDTVPALETLRKPLPNQAEIDSQCAASLRMPFPSRPWKGD